MLALMCEARDMMSLLIPPSWMPFSGAFYHANVLRAPTAVAAITVKAKVLFLNLS